MGKGVVHHGDCLEVIAGLPPNSIDAIVTDPPYGLGFMGKEWDSLPPGKEWADECQRVLKPGGHLVAFGGSRTYHRLAVAIEDAGFEIRDQLMWLYGSGFPKSLDVSKAIDKASKCPDCDGDGYYDKPGSDSGLVDYEERSAVCRSCEGTGGATRKSLGVYDSRNAKTTSSMLGATDPAHENYDGSTYGVGERHITAPATPEAQKWNGWGTALKPAHEPIVLARKPLTGTVAANVQEYGTGALNVDGCRVEAQGRPQLETDPKETDSSVYAGRMKQGSGFDGGSKAVGLTDQGRWPANLILDPEAGAMLDEQSGERPTGQVKPYRENHRNASSYRMEREKTFEKPADTGGASRFFYTAKASSAERNAGLDGFQARESNTGYGNIQDGRPHTREGYEYRATTRNSHPTVKPIDLMRWLVRLVTPPGGTVLDPFTGSGTTGIAAALEGFDFIGIEREAEYLAIAEARIEWWSRHKGDTAEVLARAGLAEKEARKHEEAGQGRLL